MNTKQPRTVIALFIAFMCAVPLVQGGIEIKNHELPHIIKLFTQWPTSKHLRPWEDELENRSFIENAVRPRMLYWEYVLGRDGGAKALLGKQGWLFYTTNMDYLFGPYITDPRITLPVGKEPAKDWDPVPVIVDFKEQLAARGIDLLVVPMPAKATIYPEMATSRTIKNPTDLHANTRRLMGELQASGVEVMDLYSLYLRARAGHDTTGGTAALYLKRDTHYSGRGVYLAAQAIAARVRRYPWWADSLATAVYTLKDTLVERYGDIGEMTQLPRNRELFPAETTLCRQVLEAESGKPYRNKKDARVLFLGDSYARIYQTDAPKSAGIVALLAHELKMPFDAIINNGGASTLVRTELVKKPEKLEGKKLVIWEFCERDVRFGMEGWKKLALP
jgi:hypothetical protein